VLVGAHYDSVIDAPCADDNAAAVAIALKVGERLVESPTKRDVVIAIFDAEEPPYYLDESMGSVRFFHDQRDGVTFHCAIIMDLCGHDVPSPVDIPGASLLVPAIPRLLFVMGSESHPELPSVVRSASRGDGKLPVITALNEYVGDLSDHHVFRVNDVPYLFLSCGRWEYYHMPTDTPDKLNFRKMARIAAFIERSVRELDGVMTGTAKPHDTTEFDIEMFKRALGPIGTTIAMKAVGLRELRSREDFDAIAYGLMSTGLV